MNMTFIPSRSRSKNSSQLKPSTFERLLWRTVFPAQNGMCYHRTISFLQLVELHRALKIDQLTLVLQADAVITGIRFHHSRFSQHIFRSWIKISQFWLIASRSPIKMYKSQCIGKQNGVCDSIFFSKNDACLPSKNFKKQASGSAQQDVNNNGKFDHQANAILAQYRIISELKGTECWQTSRIRVFGFTIFKQS